MRDHLTNLRIGLFLEIGTTIGAITGAFLAGLLAPSLLFVIFGIVLIISAVPLVLKLGEELPKGIRNDRWANWLHLAGSYPDKHLGKEVSYQVTRTPLGLAMMYVAGMISGLLGIGSGSLKVLAMDTIMRLPMKVSTTTSNFMIGVTAAASAGIYARRRTPAGCRSRGPGHSGRRLRGRSPAGPPEQPHAAPDLPARAGRARHPDGAARAGYLATLSAIWNERYTSPVVA